MAKAHLKANPKHRKLSGNKLAKLVKINGKTVSYKTWNEAKRSIK